MSSQEWKAALQIALNLHLSPDQMSDNGKNCQFQRVPGETQVDIL